MAKRYEGSAEDEAEDRAGEKRMRAGKRHQKKAPPAPKAPPFGLASAPGGENDPEDMGL
jgi:hypothetical protein